MKRTQVLFQITWRALPVAILLLSSGTVCAQNLFDNSSLDGPASTFSLVPPGWSNVDTGTTDTVDASGHPFADSFGGIGAFPYGDSADGGTFAWSADFFNEPNSVREGLRQSISGLSIGQTYIISFEFTNLGLYDDAGNLATDAFGAGQNYDSSGRWLVQLDLSTIGMTTVLAPYATPGTHEWFVYSVMFDASADTHTFDFLADWVSGAGTHVGMGIDNIRLSAIPLPGAAWMFGAALLGLMRFRSK